MELQGSVTLPAAPEQVWQALNDPEVLRLCIPGCEEVRQISPEEMHARVTLKLGPVRASFVGKVRLTDVRPLQGCALNFEGSGGSAGFAKGSSVIALTAVSEGTRLDYTTQASVAGKLGQIGGRLMDASARQLADRFFAAFKAHITGGNSAALPVVAGASMAAPSVATSNSLATESSRLLWFTAGLASTAIGVWIGAHWLR
jgi:carbon monoxide dehydrogenase subunit G